MTSAFENAASDLKACGFAFPSSDPSASLDMTSIAVIFQQCICMQNFGRTALETSRQRKQDLLSQSSKLTFSNLTE